MAEEKTTKEQIKEIKEGIKEPIEEKYITKYANGKIYGIYYKNTLRYIGSTIVALSERMGDHRSKARNLKQSKIYIEMRENG